MNPPDSLPPTAGTDATALLADPARAAVAHAAAARVQPGMTLGLGSGRALWALLHVLGQHSWSRQLRVATASSHTEELARQLGLQVVQLDGMVRLDLALDGADEIDRELNVLKGHGAALLREKLVTANARRFLVVAEANKLVAHLGEHRALPVEVVRFAWPDTRNRLLQLLPEVTLRVGDDRPLVTDEGHYLLHATLPTAADLPALALAVKSTIGVVEHGLFLDMADEVLLGGPDGVVETLTR
jgi:ribose 5-phosphate isomerase A